MRHYEIYELEHLANGTANWFWRWRCRRHLSKCARCSMLMEQLEKDRNFLIRFKNGISIFQSSVDDWAKK